MNWDIAETNWKEVKSIIKEQWSKLTNDRLDAIAGKRGKLKGEIQKAYGITKDEAERQVKDFEQVKRT